MIHKILSSVHSWVEDVILFSRYLLVPLYLSLSYMILLITLDFFRVILGKLDETVLVQHIIMILQLLDITMVANLVWYVAAGSYYVFVHPHAEEHWMKTHKPKCLVHITSGMLKEKMAGSLIGVSSVHLLQIFLNIYNDDRPVDLGRIGVMLAIHTVFLIGVVVFYYTNNREEDDEEEAASE